MPQTVWITGVSGFTGRHLVSLLSSKREKTKIIGIDINKVNNPTLDSYHQIDLTDYSAVSVLAQKSPPDLIFHLAGLLPPMSEGDMWRVNVGATVNLVQAIGESGLVNTRIVTIGSAAEYLPSSSGVHIESDPCPGFSSYGRIKWAQTSLALALGERYKIDILIARPFNLVGPGLPGSLVAAQFCQQFASQDSDAIRVGNIESSRDFVDIRDAVNAYYLIAMNGAPGEIYNVSTGKPTRISKLLDIFSELSDMRHEVVVDADRLKAVDANKVLGSSEKLRSAAGWEPEISLRKSLEDMYREYTS